LKNFNNFVNFKGQPDFLGRCSAKPVVRSDQGTGRLKWFQLKKGDEKAGELLACFDLYQIDDDTQRRALPLVPPKTGAIYRVPNGIRPELQRTVIEVLKC
jgi:otoferlin